MEENSLIYPTSSPGRRQSHGGGLPAHEANDGTGERLATPSHPNDADTDYKPSNYTRVAADEDLAVRVAHPGQSIDFGTVATDFISIVLPLGFVLFVALLWRQNGTLASESSELAWHNAITVLATVFPILFAAVVSRLMLEVARWRLQQGATVGLLEQLMGSRTVGSTIMTFITFRSFNLLSAILFLTWALSPLGTQALLRMKSTRLQHHETTTSVAYFDNRASSGLVGKWPFIDSTNYTMEPSIKTSVSLFGAVLLSPEAIKLDTMDLWGNVKIPFLNHAGPGWKSIPQDHEEFEFTSLTGIPLTNVSVGNTSFTVESNHLHLQCKQVETIYRNDSNPDLFQQVEDARLQEAVTIFSDDFKVYLPNDTWHGYGISLESVWGMEEGLIPNYKTWALAVDRFVDLHWKSEGAPYRLENETGLNATPANLLFQALGPSLASEDEDGESAWGRWGVEAECEATQQYIESRVDCSEQAGATPFCRVVAHRHSQQEHTAKEVTHLSFPGNFNLVSKLLPSLYAIQGDSASDQLLLYLVYRSLKLPTSLPDRTDFLRYLTPEDLGIRLAQLLNTFISLSQINGEITMWNTSDYVRDGRAVTGQRSSAEVVHDISPAWAAICLLSGVGLLGAGVLGVILKHRILGPEVLGHVSTVFRDSRYIQLSPEASRLDAEELSKDMKEVRIRYGVTNLKKDEREALIGVGREEETEKVNFSR